MTSLILRSLLVAAALVLTASPAAAGMDGPLGLPDRSQPVVVNGATTYPVLLPGVHYICTVADYAKNAALLGPYKDAGQVNLEAVYAGDDPAHPTMTVALTFPDQATANAVKAQLLPAG